MKWAAGIFVLAAPGAWVWGATPGAQLPQGAGGGSRAADIQTAGNRTISGFVISGVNGEALADAGVTLSDAGDGKKAAETATDGEGRFLFANVADGRYTLRASHRGFVTAGYEEHGGFSTAIVTGGGLDTTGLRFTLEAQAAIYGTVTEDSGDPVPQARVSLYHRVGGLGRMERAGMALADAMGHFELHHLTAGSYYLCASGEPWYRAIGVTAPEEQGGAAGEKPRSPLDVAYRLTCYPDTTDPNAAEAVEVSAGDRVAANLTLHPVPAVHISVEIPNPTGQQHGGIAPPIFFQDVFGDRDLVQAGPSFISESQGSDGNSVTTLEISGVAPGEYDVEVRPQPGAPSLFTTMDATTDHASLDLSSIPPEAEVSGKISMAGGGSLPNELSMMLMPVQGEGQGFAQVFSDGSFTFHGVRPGTYSVLLNSGGPTNRSFLFAAQLSASGGRVEGRELEVGSDAVVLNVVAAEASVTVRGFAKSNGKPTPGVFVVLVPEGASAGREALKADQTDSDGSFNLLHVLPGAYSLVAVEEGWTLDWGQPGAMARYLAKGERVNVAADAKQINLKEPVEVQSK